MTTDNATDARNRWTEWPPVPRPTTNGAAGLAEWAAGKPAVEITPEDVPHVTVCGTCGIAISARRSLCTFCQAVQS
jgi:hypothetical protein